MIETSDISLVQRSKMSRRTSPQVPATGELPAMMLPLLAALFVAASPSQAGEPRVLTWPEAVAAARRENPELSSSRHAAEASRQTYLGSYNGLLPSLSLSDGWSDSNTAGPSTNHWDAAGTLGLSLFDMGTVAGIRRAKAGLDRAGADLKLAAATLRFNLRRAFLQLLQAQENLEVSGTIHDIRRKSSELVTLRYNSGRESKGNMLRASAQALQADADLAQAGRDLGTARRTLVRHLGLPAQDPVAAFGSLAPVEPPEFPRDPEPLLARRPDLEVQAAQVRAAETGVASARSVLWPTLSSRYSRSVAGRDTFPSDRYSWTAGATLSLPLFGGGPTAAYRDIRSARSAAEAAREDMRAARAQASVEIETAWSDFARAASQAKVQAALLEAARQRGEEADIRYASGLLSYDNWEIISTDRVVQERQTLTARLNAALAEAAWDRALGKGLEE